MPEQTEIEMLLPWYVTDKLSKSQRKKVDQYLVVHPEMAQQLELIKDEHFETVMANEAIGTPSVKGIDRLMTRLDVEFGPEKSPARMNWLQLAWSEFAAGFQIPALRYAGIAAALVIAIQFTSISFLVQNNSAGSAYTTAAGPDATTKQGTQLLIAFKQSATAGTISKLLEETGGSIVKGPLADGYYQIRFDMKVATPEKVKTLIKTLEARKDVIEFVSATD